MALAHEESNRDHLRGGERTDSHHDNSHHHHHGGGHAAKHEVEHRVVEKLDWRLLSVWWTPLWKKQVSVLLEKQ